MLQFDTTSWHYRLVLYGFGVNFFTEKDNIDFDETEKTNKVVWTRKPKVVNFCPYCRGVLWSVLSLPFVYVWRLFPHKKKVLTHEETMKRLNRRGNIMKSVGGSIQFPLAAIRIIDGDYIAGAIQMAFGVVLILMFISKDPGRTPIAIQYLGPPFKKYFGPPIRVIIKFVAKYWPKKKHVPKKEIPKNPSLLKTYFTENHDKFCPPVCFVDPNDTKVRV